MIVDRSVLNGLLPVAEGYKIFNNDWTANYGNNYCYADENGNVEGVVHRQEGFPNRCKNGLHFCENPLDCFTYYPFVQWNKFAKVKGYGNISRGNKNSKVAVEILEIVKVLSWDEFLEEIKTCTKDKTAKDNSYGISNGYGINFGFGISDSYGVSQSRGISYGYGIENSCGISDCMYIKNCKGLYNSIMCLDESGKNKLFNKEIDETRIVRMICEVKDIAIGWYPKFTNAFDLRAANGNDWKSTPAPKIKGVEAKEAYKDMPKELVEYFKALPEFDGDIFKEITGIEVEEND